MVYFTALHLGVAQLVARYLGVVEAAGSSPVTQTNKKSRVSGFSFLFSSLFSKFLLRLFRIRENR